MSPICVPGHLQSVRCRALVFHFVIKPGKSPCKHPDCEVDVLFVDAHRGLNPERVGVKAPTPNEHPHLFHVFPDARHVLVVERCSRLLVFNHLDAEHQSLASNVAHKLKLVPKLGKFQNEVSTELLASFLGFVFINNIQDFAGDSAGEGGSGKRVQVLRSDKRLHYFGCRDHSAHRKTVSDSFRHCDDVRSDVVRFKPPRVGTETTESGLHFIGDADSSFGSNQFESSLQEAL